MRSENSRFSCGTRLRMIRAMAEASHVCPVGRRFHGEGKHLKIIWKTAAVAAACIAFAAPVMAEEVRGQEARYGDLDLRTAQGAAELSRRIERAARRACGTPAGSTLFYVDAVEACLKHARASAAGARDNAIARARAADRSQTANARSRSHHGT
jgi:UrcA family protein